MRSYWKVWADTGVSPGKWYAHEGQIPAEHPGANHLPMWISRPKKQDWINAANALQALFKTTGIDYVGESFSVGFYNFKFSKPSRKN